MLDMDPVCYDDDLEGQVSCRRTGHDDLSDRYKTDEGRHADGGDPEPTTSRVAHSALRADSSTFTP